MISNFLNNMVDLAKSMPTNMLILFVICMLLVIFAKYTIKECIKIVIGYLLLCFLLGLFGITVPSFTQIFNWLKYAFDKFVEIFW